MIQFKTSSGSTYEIDLVNRQFRRLPRAEGRALRREDDGAFIKYKRYGGLQVGYGVFFEYADPALSSSGMLRTTRVTQIETQLSVVPEHHDPEETFQESVK